MAGYEDLNDAERLAADPTFRLISSQSLWDRGAALTSTLHWFETELLTKEENLIGLMALNRETVGRADCLDSSDRVVLNIDSSENPVHGEQEDWGQQGLGKEVVFRADAAFAKPEIDLAGACSSDRFSLWRWQEKDTMRMSKKSKSEIPVRLFYP